jgi:hypothetical protein
MPRRGHEHYHLRFPVHSRPDRSAGPGPDSSVHSLTDWWWFGKGFRPDLLDGRGGRHQGVETDAIGQRCDVYVMRHSEQEALAHPS